MKLTTQAIKAYGKRQALLPGMALDADLLLDRRRMIEWIFEPLYGIARNGEGRTRVGACITQLARVPRVRIALAGDL